ICATILPTGQLPGRKPTRSSMLTTLSYAPLLSTFFLAALLTGCANKTVKPEPQTIRMRGDSSVSKPAEPGLIKKDLFNIIVGKNTLTVNGVAIKNLTELDKFLSGY